jgi:hypothetical protein
VHPTLIGMWAAGLVHRDGEVADTPEWKQWLTDKRAGKNPPLPAYAP